MGVLIDLNDAIVDEDEASAIQSSSSPQLSPPLSSSAVCLELWHACAGRHVYLPKKGGVVVYLPQGHLEQISEVPVFVVYDLSPHVVCRVLDVKLQADVSTDEVYVQVSLVPETEIEQKLKQGGIELDGEGEETEGAKETKIPHMFCKTLTASDTSSHGGFSVPRRAAEDCFPPLDYNQQRPWQDLTAKDLHGVEWKFRHIFRGRPRRHLLTTGWTAFVNRKKLVSGDAVLFLRASDGQLRLGIRRAAQAKCCVPSSSLLSHQSLNVSSLSTVAAAISTKSTFNVYYDPRAKSSQFILPFSKFSKSINHPFSIGMRFKMQIESKDATERRYSGLITGIGDIDPVMWPGSKWRCLLVRWDENIGMNQQNRVSPWEIEPSGSVSGSSNLLAPHSKRTRICQPSVKPSFPLPVPDGTGFSDFGEPLRFQRVLQGQEFLGFTTPYFGIDVLNQHSSKIRKCIPGFNSRMASLGQGIVIPPGNSYISYKGVGFGESFRFQKVLQGQEIFPKPPFGQAQVDYRNQGYGVSRTMEEVRRSSEETGLSAGTPLYNTHLQHYTPSIAQDSSLQRRCIQASSPHSVYASNNQHMENNNYFGLCNDLKVVDRGLAVSSTSRHQYGAEDLQSLCLPNLSKDIKEPGSLCSSVNHADQTYLSSQGLVLPGKSGCKLFGFPLTEETREKNEEIPTPAMDSSYLTSYKEKSHLNPPSFMETLGPRYAKELKQLFDMKELLDDPKKRWQVHPSPANDMMLVGDDLCSSTLTSI